MRTSKVLLCDDDMEYTDALIGFLMDSKVDISISICTGPDRVQADPDVAAVILGSGFEGCGLHEIGIMKQELPVIRLAQKEVSEKERKGEVSINRYGAMDSLISTLMSVMGKEKKQGASHMHMTGVYSPARHDLQLPVAMSICSILSQEGKKVVFLDLEELSILSDLTDDNDDLLDYLYLMESGRGERISEHLRYCEGFAYLPSMKDPSEIAYMNEKHWIGLLERIAEMDFDECVILFDHFLQGMESVIGRLDDLVLLTREGDYYEKSVRRLEEHLRTRDMDVNLKRLELSMNASRLNDGSYNLSSILQGNLGQSVLREWRKNGR